MDRQRLVAPGLVALDPKELVVVAVELGPVVAFAAVFVVVLMEACAFLA